jgi:hypothetical protein
VTVNSGMVNAKTLKPRHLTTERMGQMAHSGPAPSANTHVGTYDALAFWALTFWLWLIALVVALTGAVRIAKPDSTWAQKKY